MKKFLAIIVLLVFSFTSFSQSLAAYYYSEDDITYWASEVAYYQNELNKTAKGQSYLKTLDTILENYKNDERFLLGLEDKLYWVETYNMSELSANVIEYLYAKVSLFLANIELVKLNEILNPNISDADKKTAETKILALQSSIYSIMETSLNQILNPQSLRQTGDIKINFDFNIASQKANGKVNFNNYVSLSSGSDAQFNSNIDALIQAVKDGKDIKLQISSGIDAISKDGDLYFNIKNFNVLDKQGLGDDFEKVLIKVKDFISNNGDKYIKYNDYSVQQAMDLLKNIRGKSNSSDYLAKTKTILSSPLLEAYKVESNKYYLRPTTSACNIAFQVECSDSDYKEFLGYLRNFGEVYLSINGDKTTIGYNSDYSDGKITFSGNNIDLLANFYLYGKSMATFTSSGNFTKNTTNFNGKLEFSDEVSNNLFYDGGTHKIIGNLIFNTDTSNNRNNVYILINVLDNNNTIINYEIKNVGNSYEDNTIKIEAPTNVIDFEDLLL